MADSRLWVVLLLGGASGVGKTQVSYRLARHFDVGITEVDDFQLILERMTPSEQYPALHLFPRDPEAFFALDEDGKLAHAIAIATTMAEALDLVIANHLESAAPVVLEGDFLLPSLTVRPSFNGIPAEGRVRGFILYEEDEQQIARNYVAREGEVHPVRARANWRYSEWLRAEADRLGIPTVAARPWDTVLERCVAATPQKVRHGQ
jgi:2-phosphoglycerate kinase